MTPEETEQLLLVKNALRDSNYFVVNKSTPFKPCFLLGLKSTSGTSWILRRAQLTRFITEVKKVTGIVIARPNKAKSTSVFQESQPVKEYWWQTM